MMKLQFGGTIDPTERLICAMIADWDELERYALRTNSIDQAKIAAEAKENMFEKLAMLREYRKEDSK